MMPPARPSSPLAVELAEALRAFSGKLKRRLREQSDVGDLTPSQTAVVLRLDSEGPATTSHLARVEAMRPQSMGAVVAALETAGLVASRPDPDDRRQTLLSLTETCRLWLATGRAARQDWLSRTIRDRLSPAEQDRLAAALPLLQRLVEP